MKDKPRQGEDFKESLARMRENPKAIVEHELSEFKVNYGVHYVNHFNTAILISLKGYSSIFSRSAKTNVDHEKAHNISMIV